MCVALQVDTATRLQGKEVILEYYRRYNAGDVNGVMELMAADCQCAARCTVWACMSQQGACSCADALGVEHRS
jgi:hypothetical protein